jgi:hypothetical protein
VGRDAKGGLDIRSFTFPPVIINSKIVNFKQTYVIIFLGKHILNLIVANRDKQISQAVNGFQDSPFTHAACGISVFSFKNAVTLSYQIRSSFGAWELGEEFFKVYGRRGWGIRDSRIGENCTRRQRVQVVFSVNQFGK